MHPNVFYDLRDQDAIEFIQPSDDPSNLAAPQPTYRGLTVLVDEGCVNGDLATSGRFYDSYLFGQGSLQYGAGSPPGMIPYEIERDAVASLTLMVQRMSFAIHPVGLSFVGTIAGAAPTKAELEDGASWEKSMSDKHIRLVKIRTALGE